MAYLQSNEGSSEVIAGGVDSVLLDVSKNVSQSSGKHNGIQHVTTDDCLYRGIGTSRIFHTSTITENSDRYIWCQLRQTLFESQSPNIDKS